MLIGRNLKILRGRQKISQITLAARAELTHNFINEIENGRKWVSPETLSKLAAALDAEPYHFFLTAAQPQDMSLEVFTGYLEDLTDTFNMKVKEIQGRYTPDSPPVSVMSGLRTDDDA